MKRYKDLSVYSMTRRASVQESDNQAQSQSAKHGDTSAEKDDM